MQDLEETLSMKYLLTYFEDEIKSIFIRDQDIHIYILYILYIIYIYTEIHNR